MVGYCSLSSLYSASFILSPTQPAGGEHGVHFCHSPKAWTSLNFSVDKKSSEVDIAPRVFLAFPDLAEATGIEKSPSLMQLED